MCIVIFRCRVVEILLPLLVCNTLLADPPKIQENIQYVPTGSPEQVLDLYLPAGGTSPSPLIVFIHGGGWVNGDKRNWSRDFFLAVTAQGYAAASINYRLSGSAPFPAQIEDCRAAIRWLRRHAAENYINPDKIGVWGESAGGHLAALLGAIPGEEKDISSCVQAVCDFYGPADLIALIKTPGFEKSPNAAPDSVLSRLLGGPPKTKMDLAAEASPALQIKSTSAPFLIIHGGADPVVPVSQSEEFQAALQKAGIPSTLVILPGSGHGGPQFSEAQVIQKIAFFFNFYLKSASK